MASTGMLAASDQEPSFPLTSFRKSNLVPRAFSLAWKAMEKTLGMRSPGDEQSWRDLILTVSENIRLPFELCLAHNQSSRLCFSLACKGTCFFSALVSCAKNQEPKINGCSRRLVFLPIIFIVLKAMKLKAAFVAVTLGNLFILYPLPLAYLHWLRELEVCSSL